MHFLMIDYTVALTGKDFNNRNLIPNRKKKAGGGTSDMVNILIS